MIAEGATDTLVEVVGVTHRYGTGARATTVLHDVTLSVAPGEIVALAGRSGSGKSTLCHLVAGVERPTSGSVRVAGRLATEVDDWAVVSLLPQTLGLCDELSVGENATLPALLRGEPGRTDLLDLLGLAALATRPGTQTSLGEQQRTAIARALVLSPRLAVLDEPTGHQDDEHVAFVVAAMDDARSTGTAVLVATHDPRVLVAATRVIRLDGGSIHPSLPT
jgi:ABC-type lipoprotein export system ATPase subunit